MAPRCLAFALFLGAASVRAVCPISEQRCQDILYDRYAMTTDMLGQMPYLKQKILEDSVSCIDVDLCPLELDAIVGEEMVCTDGYADGGIDVDYPCRDIDLMSFVPLPEIGSHVNASGNDIWGWTAYDDDGMATGYYALTGQSDGMSIVDITDPANPNVLAFVPTNVDPFYFVIWRDIKTYGDYAFVVADDYYNSHGMQIVDMPAVIAEAELYQQENEGMIFDVDISNTSELVKLYEGFGSCHNIFVNEDSGFLYAVGIRTEEVPNGGIQIVDVRDAFNNPVLAGSYSTANYTHDIQCVNYHGPDTAYVDHEICFAFTPLGGASGAFANTTGSVTILDVTNKSNIITLSRTESLEEFEYVHQGWVTTSHEFLLMDDELDEFVGTVDQQTTYIYDIRDLTAPTLVDLFESNLTIIDHNQYIIDNGKSADSGEFRGYSFQSNYEGGLRVINIDGIAEGEIFEVAYFDSYIWAVNTFNVSVNVTGWDLIEAERHDTVNFRGAWSVYPFFKPDKNADAYSDIVVLQNINTGLMVLRHNFGLNDIFEEDMSTTVIEEDCVCTQNEIFYCCNGTTYTNECYAECEGFNVTASCEQEECSADSGEDSNDNETDGVEQRTCVAAMVATVLFAAFVN